MDILSELSGLNLSELDKCVIQDNEGTTIGRLIDCTLKMGDTGMKLTKFVVGGSKLEEFLERIKIKKDIDPVFPINVIKKVSPGRITLTVGKDDLKSTHLDSDVLEKDEYKLTSLRRTKVLDANGNNIGRVIDLKFDGDSFHLILGDSVATEWAESVGLQPDIDFLISPSYIEKFGMEEITLNKEKKDLKSTFIVNLTDYKNQKTAKVSAEEMKARNSVYFPTIK